MLTVEEAVAEQERLAPQVIRETPDGFAPNIAVGLDVAYAGDDTRLVAAAVAVDTRSLAVLESAVADGVAGFPYVPGLFAYRELPWLVEALGRLASPVDVLVCDGQGLAHPRRFGLACHVGVVTGIPSIGVGKQALGRYEMPGPERGDWTPLVDDGEVVGRALRTQDDVKPVFVSIGHLMDLDTACEVTLTLAQKYRQPETTRAADQLCRQALARGVGVQDVRD
ncbi:endonuclease V [Actinocrispum sp. NPDC049592]|uniref:endonuclease V n=1 Tax=Actinocrispum sp. NPDC049592 TaxID=3154835 RepID=UPI00342F4D03